MLSILNKNEFVSLQSKGEKVIVFFWADWHEPSKKGGQMQGIFEALSQKYQSIKFCLVEAEIVSDLSELLEVTVVPTFFSYIGTSLFEKFQGANPSELSSLAKRLNEVVISSTTNKVVVEDESVLLNKRLEKLINSAPIMLFIKGSPTAPRCGFSRQIIEILTENQIPFASFDILTDESVRSGLKLYSDWPTYPQLYANGSLIGGLDIVKEMLNDGSLKQSLGVTSFDLPPSPPSIEERLKALINQAPVMVFIKGSPTEPKCGFSRTIISILNENNIQFSYFDILTDEEVRSGLKTFSDWPTYPQLYVNGALVGGLDIVKEMVESGDLKEQLGVI